MNDNSKNNRPRLITTNKSAVADIPSISLLCCAVYAQVYGHTLSPEQLRCDLDEHYSVKEVEADFHHPDKEQFVARWRCIPGTRSTSDDGGEVDGDDIEGQEKDGEGEILGIALLTRETDCPALISTTIVSSGKSEGRRGGKKLIELERLYVGVEHQGQGIGSALIHAVEVEAMKQGFIGIWLGVWEENRKAIGFYENEKIGFVKVGEHDWGSQRDWIMVRYLQ